jgi:hypothetical protein
MWYDESVGYITPIAESTLISDAFTPILTSGNLNAANKWASAITVGEKSFGSGKIIICQLKLKNRLATNPAAAAFAKRLLESLGTRARVGEEKSRGTSAPPGLEGK